MALAQKVALEIKGNSVLAVRQIKGLGYEGYIIALDHDMSCDHNFASSFYAIPYYTLAFYSVSDLRFETG